MRWHVVHGQLQCHIPLNRMHKDSENFNFTLPSQGFTAGGHEPTDFRYLSPYKWFSNTPNTSEGCCKGRCQLHSHLHYKLTCYIIVRHQTHGVYWIWKPEGPGLWRPSKARALTRAWGFLNSVDPIGLMSNWFRLYSNYSSPWQLFWLATALLNTSCSS